METKPAPASVLNLSLRCFITTGFFVTVILLTIFPDNLCAQKISFSATKRTIEVGDTVTLKWHVRRARKKDIVTLTGVNGTLGRKGQVAVNPEEDSKYVLTVKRKNNEEKKQIKIRVKKPEIIYFTGSDSIPMGATCLLKWKTRNTDKVEIINEYATLNLDGDILLMPAQTTEYVLKACNKSNYCVEARHKVKMGGDFASGPAMLRFGESGLLEWRFDKALHVEIEGLEKNLQDSGSKKISPASTTQYKFIVKKKTEENKDTTVFAYVKVPVIRTNFIKGVKDYLTLPSGRKLMFDIIAVNWQKFPDEIRMKVMITDTAGNYISGLAPPYISEADARRFFKTIIETVEGKKYAINDFSVKEIRSLASTPHDISLVLDYSGSMSSCYNKLDKATKNFISKKHNEDRLAIVRFDDSIGVESPLKKNANDILSNILFNDGKGYQGSTALYVAADAGMQLLEDTMRSRQLLLMTDGFENSSMFYWGTYYTFATEVIKEACKKKVSITTIDFGGSANTPLLQAFADMSGGNNYQLDKADDIEKVFAELQHLYHNYYEIVYRPATDKGNRTMDLVYDDNTGNLATTSATAYINDSIDIDSIENEGIVTMTPFKNNAYNNMTIKNRQTVALFEFNKYELDDVSKAKLDVVVQFLKRNKDYKIVVLGHSDLKGDIAFCNKISVERADEVYKYLRKKGIASSRIISEGKGKNEPVWTAEDAEWKAQENRRVEVLYVKK
ncbi:MAG: Peptidoglycan-associated lipoprotein precursor [Bacteroidetes bacterium ADurb.Bin408]|nr:MAG: Peptidoglycan-associated lipoprotein precursor [Bacteroidetes bacterium ADurb.Bin408]